MSGVKTHLSITDNEGRARNIILSDVISFQPYLVLSTVMAGGVSMAGGASEAILLKCHSGNIVVPRSIDNDREILDLVLTKLKESQQQTWGMA